MDLTRRALLGAGAGVTASAASGTLLQRPAARGGYVTPQQFGAVANDPRPAEANVRAFNAMAREALASGLEMVVPTGVWFLKADGSPGNRWDIRPGPARHCAIRGEGGTSVIRRAPAGQASKFSSMIRLWTTAGDEWFDLEGLAIDGNEAAFPFDPADIWAYQQSHCVELAAAPRTAKARGVRLRDVSFSGVVADGIKIGAQCDSFEALRVSAHGRLRRRRSDIQFSRLPRLAVVTDSTVDAFEAEPSQMVPGARMQLKNLVARWSFDLAGPEDDRAGRLMVVAEKCQGGLQRTDDPSARKATNFNRLDGVFANCAFATSADADLAHSNVVRASTLRFQSSEFQIGRGYDDPAVAAALFAHFERPEDAVTFIDCRFRAESGVTNGAYLGVRGNSPSSLLRLQDCVTDSPLDSVAVLAGPARVELSGGTLRARRSLVAMSAKAARKSAVNLDRASGWSAPRRVSTREVTPPRPPSKP